MGYVSLLFYFAGGFLMIHKFKQKGFNIVLDVNSGGVHVVDDLTYDLLDNTEPPFEEAISQKVMDKLTKVYREQDILECYEELRSLYNDKILYSEDDYEKFAKYHVASPVKAMCLHIAHDCNLRCEYCFASTGDFGEGRKLMTYETGKKAIDFLLEKSLDRKNLELDFFGGEELDGAGCCVARVGKWSFAPLQPLCVEALK